MPKRTDIKKILLIGSGPIIIGQACEFDYSGTQACKALLEEGYEVVLVNSNPATIMTDPQFAHRTYVEPVTPTFVARIIEKERPDALLPTLGGQTGLNTALQVAQMGILEKFNCEMIGANAEVIQKAEDRKLFKEAMTRIGLENADSGIAYNPKQADEILSRMQFPIVIRPSYTLGGTGGGVAYNRDQFDDLVQRGLDASSTWIAETIASRKALGLPAGDLEVEAEILVEEYLAGWKEMELEVMRDKKDNVVIICGIENFDPMGVHTGDSITVAPIQTLTDREYQRMRDAAIAVIREIGVETGGSNIQFAINPKDGRMVVIEMNPRVSRSSALASKATGFPIAKIAAKLAVGYTLDELRNDITRQTPACFEPTIDYCVVKIPRWTFEKFPEADETLTTQMKSVGEAMAIGRTFKQALQKGLRSMEVGRYGLGLDAHDLWLRHQRNLPVPPDEPKWPIDEQRLARKLHVPSQGRMFYIRYAMKLGWDVEKIHAQSGIDRWFLDNIQQLVQFENVLAAYQKISDVPADVLRQAKQWGYSDVQLAMLYFPDAPPLEAQFKIREHREKLGIEATYKLVDTCAAEFEAFTPYYYSTYENPMRVVETNATRDVYDDEIRISDREKIVILGGGPNRIGQGIEFDYCCVQAAFAARELGYEAVMVNSNPETVSTDYDTSDMLFFEPLTHEDVLTLCAKLKPKGVIVQLGGQTPLNLAQGLADAGVPIAGTSVESIARAEDRDKFRQIVDKLGLRQAANGIAYNIDMARAVAAEIGYPVLVRPSYVLGGRAMEIVDSEKDLEHYMAYAVQASQDHPVLVDRFLKDAIEVDLDAVCDGRDTVIIGVMEHIEQAGVHSGDSSCVLPPWSLPRATVDRIKAQAVALARELEVRGLMNIQFAVKGDDIYVLEVNPRASRTVPFVSKSTGMPWARIAAKVMMGKTLDELGASELPPSDPHWSVKKSVFPFNKFPGVDVILGPEMRSTGEVMGIDASLPIAFAKAMAADHLPLPTEGRVFLSVRTQDKDRLLVRIAIELRQLGLEVICTEGTHKFLLARGVQTRMIRKLSEGGHPNIEDMIKNQQLRLIITTPTRRGARTDEGRIRALATLHRLPLLTTLTAAHAAVGAIRALKRGGVSVKSLQEYFHITTPPAMAAAEVSSELGVRSSE